MYGKGLSKDFDWAGFVGKLKGAAVAARVGATIAMMGFTSTKSLLQMISYSLIAPT